MGRRCRFHASLGLATLAIAVAGHARAEEQVAVDGTPQQASDRSPAWGVRFNVGGGLAKLPEETDLALGARAGLDGEYWFSKHFGIGGELGAAAFTSFELAPGPGETAKWLTLAPSIAIRGSGRGSFLMLRLAGGVTRDHFTYNSFCDEPEDCKPSSGSYDAWGPYVALTGAAVMNVAGNFEFGAFMRVELAAVFLQPEVIDGSGAFTFGISLGFEAFGATPAGD